jgi:Arc/MetJ-type ribon-helix-helix transcriptional regulator
MSVSRKHSIASMTIKPKGAPTKINPQNHRINIYVTEEEESQLSDIAKKLFRSKSSVVNEAIRNYLNANKATTSDILHNSEIIIARQ